MIKTVKILFLIGSLVLMLGCSATTIIVNEKTNLNEYSKVECAITKSDSIIDFRKSIDGYAKVNNNIIVSSINTDSVRNYSVSEFKTIYATKETNLTTYIIGGVIVTAAILVYLFGNINVGG